MRMVKKVLKRKKERELKNENTENVEEQVILPVKRMSDEPPVKKAKWINRQRVLVFASRGISYRDRHLMEDLKKLMPHHRAEAKMERQKNLQVVNEICESKNCNKAVLFEGRRKRDLYVWFSNAASGPSAKFLVENIYTMAELKLTGNCLRGSRPLLSFDENFSNNPHYVLLKELFTQIFGVPNHHPKSQPFFDHVYTFSVLDNRIWFRNFQVLTEDGALAEVGPRFVLNPVKIFAESFGGETIWDNPFYVSPAKYRQSIRKKAGHKYMNRIEQKVALEASKPEISYALNPLDEIFKGDPLKKAAEIEEAERQQLNGLEKKIKIKKANDKKKITKEVTLKTSKKKTKSPAKILKKNLNKENIENPVKKLKKQIYKEHTQSPVKTLKKKVNKENIQNSVKTLKKKVNKENIQNSVKTLKKSVNKTKKQQTPAKILKKSVKKPKNIGNKKKIKTKKI